MTRTARAAAGLARLVAKAAGTAAIAISTAGCPLIPVGYDGEFPADGTLLECTITVRDEGGNTATRTNLDPDFEALFYLEPNRDCIEGWGYETLAEAELDWRRFAASKLATITGFGPGWCEIEARCEEVGEHTICSQNVAVENAPLAVCEPPPPPPAEVCFETLCGDPGVGCEGRLLFADVAVGQSAGREVGFVNCGAPGAPDVTVAPGPIEEVAGVPLFDFLLQANGCVQDPFLDRTLAAGESCNLQVVFAPVGPGEHEATIGVTWTVAGAQVGEDLALLGTALGGALQFVDAGPICLDDANPSTIVTVQNVDPAGGVQVLDVFLEVAGTAEFTATTAEPLPFFVAPGGATDIAVTAVTTVQGRADLGVRWGGDADLDLSVELQYRPQCPASP